MAECTGSTLLYRVYSPSQTTSVYTALYSREYTTAFQLRRTPPKLSLHCTGCYYYGCTSCTMFFLRGELSFYSSCPVQRCTAHSTAVSSTLALSASRLCTTETRSTLLLSFEPSCMLWLSLHAVTSSIMLNISKKHPKK